MLMLTVFTFLLFSINVSASPIPNSDTNSKTLSLKADFWFAMFAIASLASMRLIKPSKD